MMGISLFAVFDLTQRQKVRQTSFLTGLIVLLIIHLAGELFIKSGAYVYAPSIAGFELPLRVLLGPALFFYAHACMSPEKTIDKKLIVISLVGPVLIFIIMSPFLMIPSEQRLALATPETRDPELWRIAVYTCTATTLIFIFYTIYFLLAAKNLHANYHQQLMERFSDIKNRSLDWFKPMLLVWGAVWILYAIKFFIGFIDWRWSGFQYVLPTLEVVALTIFIQKALQQKTLTPKDKGNVVSKQQRKMLISAEKMQSIAIKLEQAMKEDKLFLDESISLHKISERISESENHISETLSQHLKTNFFQYVNGFRIEQAKASLQDRSKQITSIAYDVGFNSRSTFNNAFKKLVGTSPTSYRNTFFQDE